jgi:hypothetical protein
MVLSAKTEAMGHADNLVSEIVGEVSDKYNTLSKVEQAFTELTEGSTSSIKDLDVAIESKSPIGHDHDDRYYDKVTVENMIETGISGANLEQYVTKSLLTEELAKKPDHDHTHTISEIKELDTEINTRIETATTELNNTINASLETKAPIVHEHNDIYYTKEIVDERIQAGVGSIDLKVLVTKSELIEGLATKAEAGHTHKVLEIEGLQDELNKKADTENTVSKSDFNAAMETKAPLVHSHDGVHAPAVHDHSDIYYNKEEIGALLDQNAGDVSHDTLQAAYKYTDERISDVIGQENELGITTIQGTVEALIAHNNEFNSYKTSIDTSLENKAPLVHVHGVADINGLEEELDNKLSKDDYAASNKDLTDYVDDKIQEAKTYTDTSIAEIVGVENDKQITSIKEMVDLFVEHETEFKDFQATTNATLETKENKNHNHDDAYAPKEHEHDLEDLHISESFYDKTEVNNILTNYSPLVHDHEISEINKLQETLDSKANAEEINNRFNNIITDIENDYMEAIAQAISELIDGAPDAMNTLNELAESIKANKDIYDAYVKEVNSSLASKEDKGHNHDDAYAPKEHEHDVDDLHLSDTYYDKTEIANMLKDKSDVGHDHDDVYDNKYSPMDHHHTTNEIDDFNTVLNTSIADASSKTLADANAYTEDRISEIIGIESGGNTSLSGLAFELTNHINDFEEYKSTINAVLENKENKDHDHKDIYAEKEHKHNAEDLHLSDTYYNKTEIANMLKDKSDVGHDHDDIYDNKYSPMGHHHTISEITDFDSVVNSRLADSAADTLADANAYTEQEIAKIIGADGDGASLSGLAGNLANHIDDFNAYKSVVDTALENKAPLEHTHSIGEVDGLEDLLDSKLGEIDCYTKEEMDTILATKEDITHTHEEHYTKEETNELLKKKSDFPHYHDDRYYLKYQVDAKINNLQIGKYATLENLQAWAELFAPKTHEHENAQNFGLIDDLVLQNLLTRVYGFVYEI